MAELTHEQLWKVCQPKQCDYEPYGQRKRLKAMFAATLFFLDWPLPNRYYPRTFQAESPIPLGPP
jgi:hypothetical protein